MDETYIMNDVKEKLCYVSTDFERELQAARSVRTHTSAKFGSHARVPYEKAHCNCRHISFSLTRSVSHPRSARFVYSSFNFFVDFL